MKEIDSNRDDLLLLNKEDFILISKSSDIEKFDKYIKVSAPKESDITSLIQKLNKLPCCLNTFMEKILETQNKLSLLLEIRRRNIKIKINTDNSLDEIVICQWCMENCCKYYYFTEKEINITEANSKICSCGAINHEGNLYLIIKNFKLNSDEQNEINKITDLCNDSTIKEKKNILREEIINLIKGKNNDKILQIICNMLNIIQIKIIFNSLDYNDDIYSKIFSCLKESTNYSSYNTIMCEYISNYFLLYNNYLHDFQRHKNISYYWFQ